jgi:hypothetical protein
MVRNDLCIQIAIEIGIEIAHHAAIADLILSKLISMPARRCGLAAMVVSRHFQHRFSEREKVAVAFLGSRFMPGRSR